MAEYIEKETVKAAFKKNFAYGQNENFANLLERVACEIVDKVAVADVQPVKRGRWYHINNEGFIYCSECQNEAYWDTDYGQQLFDYCPYCGAKMKKP